MLEAEYRLHSGQFTLPLLASNNPAKKRLTSRYAHDNNPQHFGHLQSHRQARPPLLLLKLPGHGLAKLKSSWGLIAFGALGFELAASVAVGVYIGIRADDHFNCSPFGVVSGLLIGSVVSFFRLLKYLKAINGQDSTKDRGDVESKKQ